MCIYWIKIFNKPILSIVLPEIIDLEDKKYFLMCKMAALCLTPSITALMPPETTSCLCRP